MMCGMCMSKQADFLVSLSSCCNETKKVKTNCCVCCKCGMRRGGLSTSVFPLGGLICKYLTTSLVINYSESFLRALTDTADVPRPITTPTVGSDSILAPRDPIPSRTPPMIGSGFQQTSDGTSSDQRLLLTVTPIVPISNASCPTVVPVGSPVNACCLTVTPASSHPFSQIRGKSNKYPKIASPK